MNIVQGDVTTFWFCWDLFELFWSPC